MNIEAIHAIYNSSPILRFCELFDGLSSLWDYSDHSHPYLEIIYHLKGEGRRNFSDSNQDFSLFDIVVHPSGISHHDDFLPDPENEVYCIWVEIDLVKIERPIKIKDRDGEIEYLFKALYRESKQDHVVTELTELLIKTIIITILRFEGDSLVSPVNKVIQFLHTNLDKEHSLNELAELEHVSKSYLTKAFKAKTGLSIFNYLHAIRIKAAKRFLISSNMKVEEIAVAIGFPSPKYFYRVFRNLEGVTPRAYREKYAVNETKAPTLISN